MRTHATATVDLKCAGCQYILRGLPNGGRCPECGCPVAESLINQKRTSKFFFAKWGFLAIAGLHLLLATLLIALEGTPNSGGEGYQALVVLDLPLLFLWYWVVGTNPISAVLTYMTYCAIAGSVLYGLVGALLGFFIDWVWLKLRQLPQK